MMLHSPSGQGPSHSQDARIAGHTAQQPCCRAGTRCSVVCAPRAAAAAAAGIGAHGRPGRHDRHACKGRRHAKGLRRTCAAGREGHARRVAAMRRLPVLVLRLLLVLLVLLILLPWLLMMLLLMMMKLLLLLLRRVLLWLLLLLPERRWRAWPPLMLRTPATAAAAARSHQHQRALLLPLPPPLAPAVCERLWAAVAVAYAAVRAALKHLQPRVDAVDHHVEVAVLLGLGGLHALRVGRRACDRGGRVCCILEGPRGHGSCSLDHASSMRAAAGTKAQPVQGCGSQRHLSS